MANGIPLIFLHAFPLDRRMWDVTLPAFNRHFNVIAVNLRGGTMSDMASNVWKDVDNAGVTEKSIFIGQSMGGYTLFPLATQRPDGVRSLIFVSTKAAPDTPQAREGRAVNIELVKTKGVTALAEKITPALLGKTTQTSRPEAVAFVKKNISEQNPDEVCAALRAMAERPDSTNLISAFHFPMLSLWGEEDTIISSDDMKAIVNGRPKSDFDKVPGAGHLLNLEQPVVFADKVSNFLKRRVL
jgi:pimeloyl-ACP methyl ester carboxylesterase